ncbi:hypothetical protein CHUAL_012097 [Chamberlinius hualienensis]
MFLFLRMLLLKLLLTVSIIFDCNCNDSSVCNDITLNPSEYEIRSNNTLYIYRANLTIFNATLKGNDIVCVPLSVKFRNCKVKQVWYKYDYAIQYNLYAMVLVAYQFYDPTNYIILQNDSLVTCCQCDDVISEFRLYVVYWVNYGLRVISTVILLISLALNLMFFTSNCHSKCLICHLGSLSALFICYSLQPYVRNLRKLEICYFLFIINYFPLMAAVFWLNAISFEIWYFLSQMQTSPYNIPNVSTIKRWRIYQLYGWGTPLTMTTLIIVANMIPWPSSLVPFLYPQLELDCWINNSVLAAIFYYAPVCILMVSTFIFFGLTVHIIKYASIGTVDNNRKRRKSIFNVTLKLVCVTGIFWTAIFVYNFIGLYTMMGDLAHYRFGLVTDFSVSGQGIIIGLVHIDRLQLFERFKQQKNSQHLDPLPQPAAIIVSKSMEQEVFNWIKHLKSSFNFMELKQL